MRVRDWFARDVRHAARALVRTPSFSLVALITLTLGLGAATAIFTLLDPIVLRSLPYPGADRLVELASPVPLLANPISLASTVTRLLEELEPQAATANVQTMESVVARSIARHSFTMALLLIAGLVAIVLSAVGIYGVVAYIVAQRRGEIGIRMALGACASQMRLVVLRQSVALAAIGIVAGTAGALATTRMLGALLFGVQPNDPATLAAVPLLLLAVVMMASYLPARRASSIDPAEALRGE